MFLKVVCLCLILHISTAYRILVFFPTASFSHQRAQIALSQALVAHGHEVTILSPDPFKTTNPNIRQIDLHFLYEEIRKLTKVMTNEKWEVRKLFGMWGDSVAQQVHEIFKKNEVQVLMKDKTQKFDAVLVEYLMHPVGHALAEKYNATLIGMTTLAMQPWMHRSMGNPTHPILHPVWMYSHPRNPNIFQRIRMLYDNYDYDGIIDETLHKQESLLQQYVPENKLSVSELMYNRVDFVIECVSPAQGFTRPLLPNTKQIGFMHIEPPKALPKDLQTFLNSSTRGVVYVSFGSNVKSVNIGDELMNILKTSIGSLPYDVLWKYENNSMPNKPKNIKTITWAPQLDVLAHPSVKLFVTQGGFQSTEETMSRGVPVVVIPFFGDQEFNAQHMEELGMGKRILKTELTVSRLTATILEVIRDPRYKRKVTELGDQVRDTPMNATETGVWYIEHAIRNRGADLFKYKGKSIPFYQFYFLDIAVLLLGLLGVAGIVGMKVFGIFAKPDGNRKQKKQ